ncbi:MAG: hypothetical protein ABFD64_13135 [Armatimonadota bacterium]
MNRNGKAVTGIILAVVIIAAAAVAGFIYYNKTKPKPWTCPEGRFSVAFSGDHRITTMFNNKIYNAMIPVYCITQTNDDGYCYKAKYWDFPAQWLQTAGNENLMKTMTQVVLMEDQGSVTSTTDAVYSGYPCKELVIQCGTNECAWVRMFLVNGRSYAVIVTGSGSELSSDGRKFLDSFKIN